MGHYTNIVNYYRDIHRLKKWGGYSILEINSMIPYELDIYALQVLKDIREENGQKNGRRR